MYYHLRKEEYIGRYTICLSFLIGRYTICTNWWMQFSKYGFFMNFQNKHQMPKFNNTFTFSWYTPCPLSSVLNQNSLSEYRFLTLVPQRSFPFWKLPPSVNLRNDPPKSIPLQNSIKNKTIISCPNSFHSTIFNFNFIYLVYNDTVLLQRLQFSWILIDSWKHLWCPRMVSLHHHWWQNF